MTARCGLHALLRSWSILIGGIMKTLIAAAVVCASATLAVPALAQDDGASPWFFRLGVADLANMHGLKATLSGGPLPGAELNYHQVYTALVEVGYNFAPDW